MVCLNADIGNRRSANTRVVRSEQKQPAPGNFCVHLAGYEQGRAYQEALVTNGPNAPTRGAL